MDHLSDRPTAALSAAHLFDGGGETGAILRATEWAHTPLGPVETWPQSLRTALRICLTSRHPLLVWWGPALIKLYNDPYIPVVGKRHPWALGEPGREVWPEIWHIIGPMLQSVLDTGQATWSDDQLLPLERNGYLEETYFTYSYSPIEDESGKVGGVFTAVTETTARVLGERRARSARDLAAALVEAHTTGTVYAQAAQVLEAAALDVPFALFYRLEADTGVAQLAATAGLAAGTSLSPLQITLADETAPWPLGRVMQTNRAEVVLGLAERWGQQTVRAGRELTPHTALVLPITEPGQAHPSAMLVAGVSPRLLLDDDYRAFYDVLVSHLARASASAHAYEAERRRAEALAEIDRAKTVFFSNVSHEFRTPLTLMLGPLEDILDANYLTADLRHQLDIIHRNGLRLLKLVNTLLDFSRLEAGRAQAVYVPTDLAALTTDLASVFRSLMEKAGLRLVIDCPPLSEPVYVDREMWEKIVLNLLSNAFKFTFQGEITVTLRQQDHLARLVVRDTGVGIPQEEVPRLFERFHRVEETLARTHEGSGIGLALVQDLVHLHGGSITVQSQVGAGTAFSISLPLGTAHLPAERLQVGHAPATTALGAAPFVEEARRWLPEGTRDSSPSLNRLAQESPSSPPFRLGKRQDNPARLLLADDNADLRDYLTRLLSERYEVVAVSDGAAALAAARVRPPDLVLSDVMMPELDGFGLLHALRADPRLKAVPVILLSARAGEEATIEGLQAGADDYLIKPFSAREVLARVDAHLEMARLRQEALAQAREFETIFESLTDGVAVLLPGGQIRRMNRAAQRMIGLGSQEEAGPYFASLPEERTQLLAFLDEQGQVFPPGRVPSQRILCGETLAGKSAVLAQLHTLDGRAMMGELSGAPIYDEQGHLIGGVVVFHDVTERRALERELAEQAALLDTAFEAMTESLIIYDRAGQPLRMNTAARQMMGIEAHSDYFAGCLTERSAVFVVRDLDGHLVPQEQWPIFRVLRGEVIPANQPVELQSSTLDGREVIGNHSGGPLRNQAGEITGALLLTRDVTERHRLERRTAESLAALLEMAQLLVPGASDDPQADTDLYLRIARLVQRVLSSQFTSLVLVTPESGIFEPLTVAGISAEIETRWWDDMRQGKVTDYLTAEMVDCLLAGERVTVDLIAQPPVPGQYYYGVQMALLAAVWVDPRRVCILTTEIRNRPTFTQAEQELVQAAVQLSGLVVQRNQMLRERASARSRSENLLAAQQRLLDLIDLAHDAIIARSPEGVIRSWNQGAERLYGWTAQEAISQSTHTLLATNFPIPLEAIEASLEAEGQWEGVLTHTRRDGALVIVESRQVLVRDAGDAPTAILEINRDVTEREQLQRERAAAQAQVLALEETNRRMDEFLGVASHELRTPLTTISANVQMAERQLRPLVAGSSDHAPQEARDRLLRAQTLLERTARQMKRMNRLVSDLLDVSRITAGKLELRLEPYDLRDLVREAVEGQRAAWSQRRIPLDLPGETAVPLLADTDRIGQVITNYLTNALKYSPEDRPVAVQVRVLGDQARVEVRDQGPGLSPEQQARLFERFYQVPGIEQQSGSGVGLGLGLYICQSIVTQHGGQVGVESVVGQGSTFWFTLPLAGV